MVERAGGDAVAGGPRTVASSVESYIEFLKGNRKSGSEARYAADAFILPALGKVKLEKLASDQLRKWHAGLAKVPARVRISALNAHRAAQHYVR
jgi:hypothetical protein